MPAITLTGDDFRSSTKVRMNTLSAFMQRSWDSMEAHQKVEKRALDKTFPERIKNTFSDEPIEPAVLALVHYGSHIRAFAGDVPRMLNYSLALQIYTCFEEIGRNLCAEISNREKKLLVTLKDLKFRSDFDAIRLFLEKICGVKFKHWTTLESFRKIRNIIAHHGGMVGTEKIEQERFRKAVSPIRSLRFSIEGRIHISKELNQTFFKTVAELWEAVFQQMKFGPVGTFLPNSGFEGGLIYRPTKKGHKVNFLSSEENC